jgi:hypothetical protein
MVACFQSGKSELRMRSDQIVSNRCLVAKEVVIDHDAYRVLTNVIRAGVALPVAIKASQRIRAAGLKRRAENVFNHIFTRLYPSGPIN